MRENYPLLRSCLAPEYAELDGEALGELIESIYGPGATPQDVENFFKTVGSGFKKAAGAVGGFATKAAPGMLSGAMTGAAVGGPWGALIGAAAGGAGSVLAKSKNKTARSIGGAIGGIGNLVGAAKGGGGAAGGIGGMLSKVAGSGDILSMVRGGGGAGGALGSLASVGLGGMTGMRSPGIAADPGGGGANALMSMLARPETLQALLSGAMGAYGKPNIAVGGQQVPVHAMLSALGTLAGEAAQEAAAFDESAAESMPAYVEWAEAEYGIDADSAEGRKDSVLLAFALAPNLWAGQNRPVVVNVTTSEPAGSVLDRETAWVEVDESDDSYEASEDWEVGESFEDWDNDEAGWNEEESLYAWQ
jgi:hypothetical protein